MALENAHTLVEAADRSSIFMARQTASRLADRAGFDEEDSHRVGLVATELASNVVKHAGGRGRLLLRATVDPVAEVELLSVDSGPGMVDVSRSMVDGHSTAGSAGQGLGAVQRLGDDFDIFSQHGQGTVVLSRVRAGRATPPETAFHASGLAVSMPGQDVCGDAWLVQQGRGRTLVTVMDGLGHGEQALAAAQAGIAAAVAAPGGTALDVLTDIHRALRHTRGAAGSVIAVDFGAKTVAVAGLGNIATAIVGPSTARQGVSLGGILGHEARLMREYLYPWPTDALLVVHSDGLISHWSLDAYPGLRRRHPAVICGVLYRDFQRGRDDVVVVVGRAAA
jgi:anti-sigma regulatory factor (Ser/Thr protein kinase)